MGSVLTVLKNIQYDLYYRRFMSNFQFFNYNLCTKNNYNLIQNYIIYEIYNIYLIIFIIYIIIFKLQWISTRNKNKGLNFVALYVQLSHLSYFLLCNIIFIYKIIYYRCFDVVEPTEYGLLCNSLTKKCS